MKAYIVHLQFNAYSVNVKAKNGAEAKRKAIAKYAKKKFSTLLDKKNCSAQEAY